MKQEKHVDKSKVREKRHEKSAIVESDFLTGTDVIIVPFDASPVLICKVSEVQKYELTVEDTDDPLHKLDCAMAIKQQDSAGIQKHLQMHKETRALALPRPTRRDVVKKGAKIQSFTPKSTGRITLRCGISFRCKVMENRSFIYIVEIDGMQVLVWKHAIHSIEQDTKEKTP